jgi:hypothetical protein
LLVLLGSFGCGDDAEPAGDGAGGADLRGGEGRDAGSDAPDVGDAEADSVFDAPGEDGDGGSADADEAGGGEVGDCGSAGGGLFISEVVDPNIEDPQRGRFIELYNGGARPVSLEGVTLVRYFDPEGTVRAPLPNVAVAPCAAFVIADNDTAFQVLYGTLPDWVPARDGTRGVVDNNGDDALELVGDDGEVIDQFGVPEEASGFPDWSYDDSVVTRRAEVVGGREGYLASEWEVVPTGEGSVGAASPGVR